MIRNTITAFVAIAGVAAHLHAAVNITVASAPTTANPGFITNTLTATAGFGETIVSFDFASDSGFGFFGPMKQFNPGGLPTVFSDNNFLFPFFGVTPDQDSQFQQNSADGIALAQSESGVSLRGAFAYFGRIDLAQQTWSFVHIAHNDSVSYNGALGIRDASGNVRVEPIQGILPIPEPGSLSLVGVAVFFGVGAARRRRGLSR